MAGMIVTRRTTSRTGSTFGGVSNHGSPQRRRSSPSPFPLLPLLFVLATLPCLLSANREIDFVNAHKDRKVSAVRIDQPIKVDGKLDEPEWNLAEPVGDFVQKLPATGEPASERTEVRLLFDDDHLYVGVYCFDSAGRDGIVINDITKDFFTLDSDGFQVILDTFDDDRNAFLFGTNPAAGRFDMQIGADGNAGNSSWDGIWYVETDVTDSGWVVEIAIPFKTLRFSRDEQQVWGINFERRVRRKFEDSYWSPLPPPYRLGRISLGGTLDGIEGIQQGRNLYVKPYVTAPLVKLEGDDLDFRPDAGLDVKYGLTSQMTLDATINTDFSQVEADEQRVNLTRFSLFFPEKRDFFLENASIFEWGQRRRGHGFTPDLVPFFSRRIGLTEDGEIVPILGGLRVTGKAGQNSIGVLTMQEDDFGENPSTNYSVFRYRREILRKSDVGGIFVNKQGGEDTNRTFGFDGNFTFFNYLDVSSYIVKTESPDLSGNDTASNFEFAWTDNFLEARAGQLRIGENFNPEVGFAPRVGVRKSSAMLGITPRPEETIPWIREINPQVEVDYYANSENELETRRAEARLGVTFSDSSFLMAFRESSFERLEEVFEISDGIGIEPGDYSFDETGIFYRSDRARLLSVSGRYGSGSFYDGHRDSYRAGFTVQPSHKLAAEMAWSHNDVDLPVGDFSTDLLTTRLAYSFSNKMFLNALIQYNSNDDEINSNIRFNFVHHPLSDLYIVYNERRSSTGEVLDRAIIAKLNYLFAF